MRRWCSAGKLSETLRTVGNHRHFSSSSCSHLRKPKERRDIS
ncbi:hypothetical protein [Turicimonas muris]